ncbi:MAG: hypothetical protein QOH89_1188 [Pseudonocardiales bacterium]|jgi:hypothetical protein|nr:hypothetical protein [Pseudonocardiales bacterium]
MSTIELTPDDADRVETFATNLFMATLGAMELVTIELGIRLGLYEALAGAGPTTPGELAAATGTHRRYLREWLEQQAASGVLEVVDPRAGPEERRFVLPNAHAHVLTDDDSEACMKPCASVVPAATHALSLMEDAYRTGEGVSFGSFDIHDVQAAFNRPVFRNHLTQDWLPAVEDVHERLVRGDRVRIAEVGCGEGLAAVLIASAYPNAEVDGYDLDERSIAAAVAQAERAGVGDRARFHLQDAADPGIAGDYDLVLAIEMLHDMPDPVGVLQTMRRLAGTAGTVLVVDERAEESFTAPAGEMERFLYAFSALHCLAVSMQDGGVGTGTVMRPDTMQQYATRAGFTGVTVLDVEHPQFRLYRLN